MKTFFSQRTLKIVGQMPRRFWNWEAQPKGVANRNNALNWIISHTDQVSKDVIVFLILFYTANVPLLIMGNSHP